jgi:hypothetical protein
MPKELTPIESAERTAREVLAIHYFLGKIGFDYEDIYVVQCIDKEGKTGVAVKLEAQGKTMTFGAGPLGLSSEEFAKLWIELLIQHNDGTLNDAEKTTVFEESGIGNNLISTLRAMLDKGFKLNLPEGFEDAIRNLSGLEELERITRQLGL